MKSQKDSLGFLLADVSRLMRSAFQKRLEGSTLTLAQARVLLYVSRHEGVRQVDLADLLQVQPITLARLIDQLADEKLVERRPDALDRRAYLIFLTAAASPHLEAIEQVASVIHTQAMSGLDEHQAAAAIKALQQMRSNLCAK